VLALVTIVVQQSNKVDTDSASLQQQLTSSCDNIQNLNTMLQQRMREPIARISIPPRYLLSTSEDFSAAMWCIFPSEVKFQEDNTQQQVKQQQITAPQLILKRTFTGHTNDVYCSLLDCGNNNDNNGDQYQLLNRNQQQQEPQLLVTGGADNTIRTWNINTGECINTITLDHIVSCMEWWYCKSTRTKYLLHNGSATAITMRLWNVNNDNTHGTIAKQLTFGAQENIVVSLIVVEVEPDSNNGKTSSMLFTTYGDKDILQWCLQSGTMVKKFASHYAGIFKLCKISVAESMYFNTVNASGNNKNTVIAGAGRDGCLKIWDSKTGETLCNLDVVCDISMIFSIVYNPIERVLAASHFDNTSLVIWKLEFTGKAGDVSSCAVKATQKFQVKNPFPETVYSLSFLGNTPYLVAGDFAGNMLIVNTRTGVVERKYNELHSDFVITSLRCIL